MGQILIKPGVSFGPFAPAGARILDALKRLVPAYDFDVTITSAADGEHSGPTDPHHSGEAFDLRTNTLTQAQKWRLLTDLRKVLYRDARRFYAFLEAGGAPGEHIHVQRRAGTTYTVLDYIDDL